MNTNDAMDYELETEEKIQGIKKGMKIHGAIVTCVGIILAGVNLLVTPDILWAIFPIAGMSVGIVMHYVFGVYLPIKSFRSTY